MEKPSTRSKQKCWRSMDLKDLYHWIARRHIQSCSDYTIKPALVPGESNIPHRTAHTYTHSKDHKMNVHNSFFHNSQTLGENPTAPPGRNGELVVHIHGVHVHGGIRTALRTNTRELGITGGISRILRMGGNFTKRTYCMVQFLWSSKQTGECVVLEVRRGVTFGSNDKETAPDHFFVRGLGRDSMGVVTTLLLCVLYFSKKAD